MRDYDGNVYTDCSIYDIDLLYDPSSIVLMAGKAGNDPVIAQMCQNMKIYTTCVLADGSIVLEQDKSDLNVNYCIASKGNSETDFTQPYKGSSRFPIEYEALFEPGFLDLFASRSFRRAITGNSLSMFTYVSGRTTTFKLVAEFTGERKADLDKRYNLDVTGDDESGWTVTLTSNIKEDADIERTEIPYGIVYQIDPSLAAGEKKLLQAGKNGYHEKRTAYYYLEGDNGEKEILEYLDPVETTVEAQPEIYLTGPADEDVPNQETVRLTFDPADGVWADGSNQPKIIYAAVGDIVTIPAGPEKKDQEFLYWQGSKYYPGQAYEVTEDHIFVAKYSDDDDDANEAVIVAWGASDNSDNSNNINQSGLPATNQQLVQQLPQTGEASALTQPATLISFAALALALVLRKQLGK